MFKFHCTLQLLLSFAVIGALNALDAPLAAPLSPDAPVALKRVCPERCNLAFRCDPYYSGPLVWTVVDGTCKLFKTDCLFATANCQRQNDCLPKMVATSQQVCQAHCVDSCENQPVKPVCGIFPYVTVHGDRNDGLLTFSNQCELDKWACWNAKAYIYSSDGTCF